MKFIKKTRYIKYSKAELDRYTSDKNSCVQKIHATEHLGLSPAGLGNLKDTLLRILDQKIGRFDRKMGGIILDIRNVKVINQPTVIRHDSPHIHLNIVSDAYVFQPKSGMIVNGIVKHISQQHIGVVIFRVFNVAVKFMRNKKQKVQVNQEIKIRVINFDLESHLPEIEGELVRDESIDAQEEQDDSGISTEDIPPVRIKQEKATTSKKKKRTPTSAKVSPDNSDNEETSFAIPASHPHRRSILVKAEPGTVTPQREKKRVSFFDAPPIPSPATSPVRIKNEPVMDSSDSDDSEEPESQVKDSKIINAPVTRVKQERRSSSPESFTQNDTQLGFEAFEESMVNQFASTQLNFSVQQPSPKAKGKKRKNSTSNSDLEKTSDSDSNKSKKKKQKIDLSILKTEPVKIKQERSESSEKAEKKKRKDNRNNMKFDDKLAALLNEVEMDVTSKKKGKKKSKN